MATIQQDDEEKSPKSTIATSEPDKKKTKITHGEDGQGEGENDNASSDISSFEEEEEYEEEYRPPRSPMYETSDEEPENPLFISHMKVIMETKGYVIPEIPKGLKLSCWRPVRVINKQYPELVQLAQSCLNWFMDKTIEAKGKYEFVEVKHGSRSASRGIYYYMVFAARDVATGKQEIFKARALSGLEDEGDTIDSCELAPELAAYC